MLSEQQKLQHIIDLNLEIVKIQDVDILLEKILSAARKLVNADAGCIYIKDGEMLQCRHIQNDTLQQQFAQERKLTCTPSSILVNDKSVAGYVVSTGETLNIPNVVQFPDDVPYSFVFEEYLGSVGIIDSPGAKSSWGDSGLCYLNSQE